MAGNAKGGGGADSSGVYYTTGAAAAGNLGNYQHITLQDIIDNFRATFIGPGKLLEGTMAGDVNYHAHRALQELSYDTLKSCKSIEITLPPSLQMPLPQDYINYTKITTSDANGIEHVLYPAIKTSNPIAIKQDDDGDYVVDKGELQIDDSSETWDAFSSGGGSTGISSAHLHGSTSHIHDDSHSHGHHGNLFNTRYGIDPQFSQINGSFYIDCNTGKIHFSSNLSGRTIILHYLSDHHGTSNERIIHKFAEEAMYKWIAYGCLIARSNIPENIIQRFKREKTAETRKAKIRLSNIKIEEITQIMRGKSKFIDH